MRHMSALSDDGWSTPVSQIAAAVFLALAAGFAGCTGDDSAGTQPRDAAVDTRVDTSTPQADAHADVTTSEVGAEAGTDAGADTGADGPATDNGMFATVTAIANGSQFSNPFDATPDPTGTSVYFTAMTADGRAGIFFIAVAADAGTPTALFAGSPLVSPLGIAISSDGTTLFVADLAADTGTDQGGIFSMPASGGTPALVAGTDGVLPRSLDVAGTKIYFTGTDKSDGKAGVFSMLASGGAVTVVAKGLPFVDPSGVAVDPAGNVYVVDTVASASQRGIIFKIATGSGTATPLATGISFGYPAGLALSGDGTALLASSLLAAGTDQILRIDSTMGSSTTQSTGPIATGSEAAGLHRAHAAFVYAWVDSSAGGTGTVYLLTK